MTTCSVCGAQLPAGAAFCPVCGSQLTYTPGFALPPGTLLQGKYRVERELAADGTGFWYAAAQTQLGVGVSLKELFPVGASRLGYAVQPAHSDASQWPQFKARFLDEGRILARFRHPGVVQVTDCFEENGTAYLVMERLAGESLQARLTRTGSLPPAEVTALADHLLGTLEAVHAQGLMHRDIRPENLFLEAGGRVVLINFGAARDFATGQTVQHTQLVTPGYAPLEQYAGTARYGPYTDLYALAATLYHALSGAPPTPATDRAMGKPLAPLPASVPAPLRDLIGRSLELRLTDRPQSATEARAILNRFSLPGRLPRLGKRGGTAAAGAAVPSPAAPAAVVVAAPPPAPSLPPPAPAALPPSPPVGATPLPSPGFRGLRLPSWWLSAVLVGIPVVLGLLFVLYLGGVIGRPAPPPPVDPGVVTAPTLKRVTVQAESLNLRAGDSLGAAVLTRLQRGDVLEVLEERAGWYRVRVRAQTGWVSADPQYTKPAEGSP